jgi:hypothetical protein
VSPQALHSAVALSTCQDSVNFPHRTQCAGASSELRFVNIAS